LKQQLSQQKNDQFLLVEAITEESGYLYKGEFVWVIRFFPETNEVLWVSDDFYLYRNSITDFKVTTEWLQHLIVKKNSIT